MSHGDAVVSKTHTYCSLKELLTLSYSYWSDVVHFLYSTVSAWGWSAHFSWHTQTMWDEKLVQREQNCRERRQKDSRCDRTGIYRDWLVWKGVRQASLTFDPLKTFLKKQSKHHASHSMLHLQLEHLLPEDLRWETLNRGLDGEVPGRQVGWFLPSTSFIQTPWAEQVYIPERMRKGWRKGRKWLIHSIWKIDLGS